MYERYKWLISKDNEIQAKELESYIRLTPDERLETDVDNLNLEKFDPESPKSKNITEVEKNHPKVQARAIEIVKEYIRKSHFDIAAKTEEFFGLSKDIVIDELLATKVRPYDKWENITALKEKFLK